MPKNNIHHDLSRSADPHLHGTQKSLVVSDVIKRQTMVKSKLFNT